MSSQTDELVRVDQLWSSSLRSASLAAEVDLAERDVRRALRALGVIYDGSDDRERAMRSVALRFPAAVVGALAGIGRSDYTAGNYWGAVWDAAGVPAYQPAQAFWGKAFQVGLDKLGMARFIGPQRYVTEILMHAGVPEYCLTDLLLLLADRQAQDPDVTGDEVHTWVTAPGRGSRLGALDKPVQRFITGGGEFAEDFLDRLLDLLDRLREPEFDAVGLELPEWVIDRTRSLAQDGILVLHVRKGRKGSSGRSREERPSLRFETVGRGVYLWLPPVVDAVDGEAIWAIQVDGESSSVRARSQWGGASPVAPAASFILPRPARTVRAGKSGTSGTVELDLVDPADPLLIFLEDGTHLPRAAALPAEPVWALFPAPEVPGAAALEIDGDAPTVSEADAPYGWNGWAVRRLDLSAARALRLGEGTWRTVRQARRCRLDLPDPVAGARTTHGGPVHAVPPALVIPGDGVPTSWTVRIGRPGSGTALSSQQYEAAQDVTLDPWGEVERPLIGPYEVVVRGPLGRGLKRVVDMAEGIVVDSSPPWRELTGTGLVPALVKVAGPPTTAGVPMRVDPAELVLAPEQPTGQVSVRGPDRTELLLVSPPFMAVSRTVGAARSGWSVVPLTLDTESLSETTLDVRLPAPMPARLYVCRGGKDHQELRSQGLIDRAIASFNLAAFSDTLAAIGTATLDLDLHGVRFTVARCSPRRLAKEVLVEDGRVVLRGGVIVPDLTAGCYRRLAPWDPPVRMLIDADGCSEVLQPPLRDGGDILVHLRVEDPWLPSDWPAWPGRENSFLVDGLTWRQNPDDSPAAHLTACLAGVVQFDGRPGAGTAALALYGRASDIGRGAQKDEIRTLAAAAVATDPSGALDAVAVGAVSAVDAIAAVVHAGLIAHGAAGADRDQALALWRIAPAIALIAADLDGDTEILEVVARECGDTALGLLRGEADPAARAATFAGPNVAMLDSWSPDRIENVWRAAAVVPCGLLERDARMSAARELFDLRQSSGLRDVLAAGPRIVQESTTILSRVGADRAVGAVEARGTGPSWVSLPAVSLALAFVARLAARGHAPLRSYLSPLLPTYAALARHAPRLVMTDLVLAEFTLRGVET